MEKKKPIRVIVVDDHEIFRKGLVMQLNELKSMKVVADFSSGVAFLDNIKSIETDVVLMDIKMEKINGIETTERAVEMVEGLKVLALSMFGDEEYLHNILDAGAQGYLLKNTDIKELERAIKLINEGHSFFSTEMLAILTKTFVRGNEKKSEALLIEELTKKEFEVLEYVCKGLTNAEIGEKLFLSPRTIDGYKSKIMSKFGVPNTVGIVTFALKNKLIEL